MSTKSKKRRKARPDAPRNPDIDTIVSGTLTGLSTAKWPDRRLPEFRVSSFPYCPLLFSGDPGDYEANYTSSFYFEKGTETHHLVQWSMAHSVSAHMMYGHWACSKCDEKEERLVQWSTKPEHPCKKCGKRSWKYVEVTVSYKGIEGHIDMILRVPDYVQKADSKLNKGGIGWRFIVLDYKCLVGSTIINTSRGFVRMDELGFKEGEHSYKTTIDSHLGRKQVTKSFRRKAPTRKLTTANGFTLEGTPIHPVLVVGHDLALRWVQLKDIKAGDWIVSTTSKNDPMWGKYGLSEDLASMMGFLTANGSKTLTAEGKGALYFHSDDPLAQAAFTSTHRKLCGRPCKTTYFSEDRATTFVIDDEVRDMLWAEGYVGGVAAEKSIPESVRKAPKKIMDAYLSAYFACDSGTTNKDAISVSSASPEMIEQLHVILWHGYGILGRRYSVLTKAGQSQDDRLKDYYYIEISGPDRGTFLDAFPSAKVSQKYGDRIRESLERRQGSARASSKEARRFIPHAAAYWNDKVNSSRLGPTSRKVEIDLDGETASVRMSQVMQFGYTFIRDIPTHVAEGMQFEEGSAAYNLDPTFAKRFNRLLRGGYHFEKVTDVEDSKKNVMVYDVCVPDGHAFTANGLVSHNTTTLPEIPKKFQTDWTARGRIMSKKYPIPANVVQISSYAALLRRKYKLNVSGISLAYLDRSGPVRSKRSFYTHTKEWSKTDDALWMGRIDRATETHPVAFQLRKAMMEGKKPSKAKFLELVEKRPCRSREDHDNYMAARFYYDDTPACPFSGRCCSPKASDEKLAAFFAKAMSDQWATAASEEVQ
jgi:hypothetical protein